MCACTIFHPISKTSCIPSHVLNHKEPTLFKDIYREFILRNPMHAGV